MPNEETTVDNNMEDDEPMEKVEESENSGSQKLSKSGTSLPSAAK